MCGLDRWSVESHWARTRVHFLLLVLATLVRENEIDVCRSGTQDELMRARPVPLILFVLLCLVLAGEAAYFLPMLPDRLATHFDASGRANGWSSQAGFRAIIAVLIVIFAAMFAGSGLLRRVPDRFMNLPNKSYWLAPDRRDQALAFISDWVRWFLVMAMSLLTLVIGMVLRANLVTLPRMPDHVLWFLLAYLATTVAMVVVLVRRFRAPPRL